MSNFDSGLLQSLMSTLAVLSSSQRCGVIKKPELVDKDSPGENRSADVNISHQI